MRKDPPDPAIPKMPNLAQNKPNLRYSQLGTEIDRKTAQEQADAVARTPPQDVAPKSHLSDLPRDGETSVHSFT